MIHFKYGNELSLVPNLAHSMFQDRADQFSKRLGWDVTVNAIGEERDQYDEINPLYIIIEGPDGSHQGSMRFLPTLGRTMINEHFQNLIGEGEIRSLFIWECTRFCISPKADFKTASKLMAAGAKLMHECSLDHFVAVFDQRMERVYRLIGASPTVIGRSTSSGDPIGVGLWEFDAEAYAGLLNKAGVGEAEMDLFYSNSPRIYEDLALVG